MSFPEANNTLEFPVYSQAADEAATDISWSQMLRTRTATYFLIKAKNTSKGGEEVLLYLQDRFYKDENSDDFVGRLPGARREGDQWLVTLNDRFQYGQLNKQGEKRWVVLHDKDNKLYQHRFINSTFQGRMAQQAVDFASKYLLGGDADNPIQVLANITSGFVGDYLHTF